MRVLALDTTTRAGSVALVIDGHVAEERAGESSRAHAERLPMELVALGAAYGVALADVDLFAVAAGPGSFTGLRIGIATVQGLAFTVGRPVAAVSTLDALGQMAAVGAREGALVAAWVDAHRGDVFSALFRVQAAPAYALERVSVVDGPTAEAPEVILGRWRAAGLGPPITFVGDGAVRYGDAIGRSGLGAEDAVTAPPLAGAIGRLGCAMAQRGAVTSPGAVQPVYVRRPDVEVERDRKRADLERRVAASERRPDPP